jgi:hypothetical protein
MMLAEWAGLLSFFLNVAGYLFIVSLGSARPERWRLDWAVSVAAALSWGFYGALTGSRPIILNAATFFCITLYGLWNRRREELAALAAAKVDQRRKYEEWFENQRRSA